MNDGVPAAPEPSVEDRLAAFFTSAPKKAPVSPPEGQQAQPAEEPVVSQDAAEQPVEAAPETEEEVSEAPPEGFVELEHLGNKYFVPPDLKQAFEANRAQATRATMELSNVRKAVEVEKLALQATEAFSSTVKGLVAEATKLQSYKEQAKKLDWSALSLDQKVDLDRELRAIDEKLGAIGNEIAVRQAHHQQGMGNLVLQAVAHTENYMASRVPGWDNEKGKQLHQYGLSRGIPVEKLTTGWFADPEATLIMWESQQWRNLQGSKPSVQNKASAAPPVIRPGSNAVQKSVASSNYQKARASLKKTGSLEDAARVMLMRKR